MPCSGVVEPEQLAILAAVVAEYCKERGIDPIGNEPEEIARLVMTFFSQGIATPEELRRLLLAHSREQAIIGLLS